MLGISVSKFHEVVLVVGNKDPHDKLPVNHTFKIPPDTQHYFGAKLIFNDDFGRYTGNEQLFRGVRVAVTDPFSSHVTILLTNLPSMGLLIS